GGAGAGGGGRARRGGAGADAAPRAPAPPRGEGAAASAFIALAAPPLHEPVEREQTAARGAVVTRAEGEPRLDLDADTVRSHARAVMRTVHDKTAGFDRRETFEAFAHPVRGRERLERQRMGRRAAGGGRDQRAHGRLIGL